ncbi:MAG: hypothetical protein JWP75_3379 [Frondihabitans sp.]|nr:hypothetical protein [Frondihabitans sp.]
MAKSMTHTRRVSVVLTVLVLAVAGVVSAAGVANADSKPTNPAAAATPTTVTADALSAPQIDGVVWSQVISGNNVFAGGNFQTARPAGAATGVGTVNRAYLLSYNVTNGTLNTRFAPVLNGQVKEVIANSAGTAVYIAGSFTKINGVIVHGIAELNATTGALITAFRPSPNYAVSTIALRSTTLYLGGAFTVVNGRTRLGLASVNATNGKLNAWAPSATGGVADALTIDPDGSKVIVGGSFTAINKKATPGYGIAALQPTTGASLPWAMNTLIRDGGVNSAITSLTPDSTGVYGSGYVFGAGGDFEGTFRADWKTGKITWMEDCHGDSYSTAVTTTAEYVAGHAHDCATIGGFTESENTIHHGIAFSKSATQKVQTVAVGGYTNFAGNPAPSLLNWFPDFTDGTFTGKDQATWSVAANTKYVVYGGEFTAVNGTPQQGLVRFAVSSLAPNKMGPIYSGADIVPTAVSTEPGRVKLSWTADADQDNSTLTYAIYRDGDNTTPVATLTGDSSVWQRPQMTYTDLGLTPGQSYYYRIRVTDPFGNTVLGDSATITVAGSMPTGYEADVLNQDPTHFWRFDGATGALMPDLAGDADEIPGTGVTTTSPGSSADGTTASQFSGTIAGFAATQSSAAAPSVLSVEAWFKTTVAGGKIVGYGSSRTGTSAHYDRHLYLTADGKLNFGVYTTSKISVTSPTAVNDGNWHQAVGTFDGTTMQLFVDGQLVASRTGLTAAQALSGYWRVGGDASWSGYGWFNGSIDDVSIYPVALTAAQVAEHYAAAQPASSTGTGTATSAPTP